MRPNGIAARAAALAVTMIISSPPQVRAQGGGVLVIDGARIVTGMGPAIEKGRVVIIGDKISAIGPAADLPTGAEVIDGKGLTVYPGLIDAYCLAGVASPPSAPAQSFQSPGQGRQGPRQGQSQNQPPRPPAAPLVWRKATDGFKSSDAIAAMRAAGYTAALFGVRGVLTPGEDVLMTLQSGEPAAAVVQDRAAVNLNVMSRGSAYPSTLMGAIAYLRQGFYDGIDFRNRRPDRPDARLESLGLAAQGKIPAIFAANSENEIKRSLKIGAEFKMRTVILGGREAAKVTTQLLAAKAAVILTDDWSPFASLAKAGVPVALGSNNLEMSVSEAEGLHAKAIDLAAKGVTEEAVLAGLTATPAAIYGASDRFGVLAAGRPAHLVVTEGGLFQKEGKVKFVVIGGKRIDAAPVKTAGGPKPSKRVEDGVEYITVTEDDADGDGK